MTIYNADLYARLARRHTVVRLTRHSSRPQGFTGNARAVIDDDGTVHLVSYATEVAYISPDGVFHKTWDKWSVSTASHIRMFADEYASDWAHSVVVTMQCLPRKAHTFKEVWFALPTERGTLF